MSKSAIAALAYLLSWSATADASEVSLPAAKGYVIAEIVVNDAATYEEYKAAVTPIIVQYGGHYLARGGASEAVEGDKVKGRVAILEFPSVAAAKAFLDSDVYQPIAAIRHKSATSRLILVEGVAP